MVTKIAVVFQQHGARDMMNQPTTCRRVAFLVALGLSLAGCDESRPGTLTPKYVGAITHDKRDCSHHAVYSRSEDTDESKLKDLKTVKELSTFTLADTDATDHGLQYLKATLPELRAVHITGCPGITNDGIKIFKDAPKLSQLTLIGTKVTGQGLESLRDSNLKKLRIDGFSDADLRYLQGQKHLESLELLNARLTDSGIAYIKGIPKLRFVMLFNCEISEPVFERLRQSMPNCKVTRQSTRR